MQFKQLSSRITEYSTDLSSFFYLPALRVLRAFAVRNLVSLRYVWRVFLMMCALSSIGAQHCEVIISEILADNEKGIKDEDGDREDWFELHNAGTNSVNLRGWWATDKSDNPTKWEFPLVALPPGGYLIVWASGKDRDTPWRPPHTNFRLSKRGEYLGLYRPSPVDGTPILVDEYAPVFPALPPDISYGVYYEETTTSFIATGDIGRYRVLTAEEGAAFHSGTDYASGHIGHDQPGGWNMSCYFDDSTWIAAATGIGYDINQAYSIWFGDSAASDCEALLYGPGLNTSLCFRKLFVVDDINDILNLTLKMRYDDGFVAFVNGVEVARENCGATVMAYNTSADTWINESIVDSWSEYNIPHDLLASGTNLLAVQALNNAATSSDFLLLPELEATLRGASLFGYYAETTPGEPNGFPTDGALIFDAEPSDPNVPRPLGGVTSQPLTVTVKVVETLAPIVAVRVYARRMYDAEMPATPMKDDGVDPDALAGDGIYSARIDTTIVEAGEMLRWRFEAEDAAGKITKLPAFIDPLDNAEYFGTVAIDALVANSLLPVFCWFVENSPDTGPNTAAEWKTFRGACYYMNNFYDNTGHTIHGQSSKGFPKKSYNFDFTKEKRFLWREGERRVKDVNLLSNYADKTKARNTLAHWVGEQCGTPSHFCQIVRVHLNGYFHGVMDLMEDSDDRMLERNGLDPRGAFYKIYTTDLVTGVKKKTRKDEDKQDLIALADALARSNPLSERQVYAYDNLNVAALVNYLAVRQLTSDSDHGHKNFLMYRDTNDTGEWQPVVWDVDLSAGHMYTSELRYFDDALYYKPPRIPMNRGSGSPVYAVLYESAEIREMYLRRTRTLMDTMMQPPGTVDGILETKTRELAALVDPDPAVSTWSDGDLDFFRWGIHPNFIQNRPREEVERLVEEYYPNRRDYLFKTGAGRPEVSGAYIPDNPQINSTGMARICEIENMPVSQLLSEKYVILKNMTADSIDISGWSITGSINHTLRPGTVLPSGSGLAADNYIGLLHIAKDARAFRARSNTPTGGERRFVQGNFEGHLPAEGGSLTLRDDTGMLIFTTNYVGDLSPSQKSLRVTEINYHPADPTQAELSEYPWAQDDDFEYIELKNTGGSQLNLTGASFTTGIDFTFPAATLAAGARLIVARNLTTFRLRYPYLSAPVFGPYDGGLNNSSDRLVLIDAGGDKVLDFEYHDSWYKLTDGGGRSLVLRRENIATNLYNDLYQWNVSWNALGSPGTKEVKEARSYHGWAYTKFSEMELQDELISGVCADPDNDGRVNWIEYALGSDPKVNDVEAPLAFMWHPSSGARHALLSYTRAINAVDVRYALMFSGDLLSGVWSPVDCYVSLRYARPDTEWLGFKERSAAVETGRFYTLILEYTGAR